MRKLFAASAALFTVVASFALVSSASAGQTKAEDAAKGVVFTGLTADLNGTCHGGYRMAGPHGETWCTHGPDAAPAGVDIKKRRPPEPAATSPTPGTAASGIVNCYGTGSDGPRVKLIYAHASNVTDRFATYNSSFVQWAATADGVFDNSAAETGGSRHVRFVTDTSCSPVIDDVTLSTTGDDSLNNTITELRNKGYSASDRKYVVWVDANVYCGIAQIYGDDKPTQDNTSNGSTAVKGEFARVDNGCWGVSGQSIEAHELMHTLGGVQTSAPHATSGWHCWDESDRMCYNDGSGSVMKQICATSHENSFDCNHDDYYYAGVFLAGSDATPPPPPPPTTNPTPPRSLVANRPLSGIGVKLTWLAPTSNGGSAVTGYRVYRHAVGGSYTLVKTLGVATSYRDRTTTSGQAYYYEVTAVNAIGESAPSNEASQTAR